MNLLKAVTHVQPTSKKKPSTGSKPEVLIGDVSQGELLLESDYIRAPLKKVPRYVTENASNGECISVGYALD